MIQKEDLVGSDVNPEDGEIFSMPFESNPMDQDLVERPLNEVELARPPLFAEALKTREVNLGSLESVYYNIRSFFTLLPGGLGGRTKAPANVANSYEDFFERYFTKGWFIDLFQKKYNELSNRELGYDRNYSTLFVIYISFSRSLEYLLQHYSGDETFSLLELYFSNVSPNKNSKIHGKNAIAGVGREFMNKYGIATSMNVLRKLIDSGSGDKHNRHVQSFKGIEYFEKKYEKLLCLHEEVRDYLFALHVRLGFADSDEEFFLKVTDTVHKLVKIDPKLAMDYICVLIYTMWSVDPSNLKGAKFPLYGDEAVEEFRALYALPPSFRKAAKDFMCLFLKVRPRAKISARRGNKISIPTLPPTSSLDIDDSLVLPSINFSEAYEYFIKYGYSKTDIERIFSNISSHADSIGVFAYRQLFSAKAIARLDDLFAGGRRTGEGVSKYLKYIKDIYREVPALYLKSGGGILANLLTNSQLDALSKEALEIYFEADVYATKIIGDEVCGYTTSTDTSPELFELLRKDPKKFQRIHKEMVDVCYSAITAGWVNGLIKGLDGKASSLDWNPLPSTSTTLFAKFICVYKEANWDEVRARAEQIINFHKKRRPDSQSLTNSNDSEQERAIFVASRLAFADILSYVYSGGSESPVSNEDCFKKASYGPHIIFMRRAAIEPEHTVEKLGFSGVRKMIERIVAITTFCIAHRDTLPLYPLLTNIEVLLQRLIAGDGKGCANIDMLGEEISKVKTLVTNDAWLEDHGNLVRTRMTLGMPGAKKEDVAGALKRMIDSMEADLKTYEYEMNYEKALFPGRGVSGSKEVAKADSWLQNASEMTRSNVHKIALLRALDLGSLVGDETSSTLELNTSTERLPELDETYAMIASGEARLGALLKAVEEKDLFDKLGKSVSAELPHAKRIILESREKTRGLMPVGGKLETPSGMSFSRINMIRRLGKMYSSPFMLKHWGHSTVLPVCLSPDELAANVFFPIMFGVYDQSVDMDMQVTIGGQMAPDVASVVGASMYLACRSNVVPANNAFLHSPNVRKSYSKCMVYDAGIRQSDLPFDVKGAIGRTDISGRRDVKDIALYQLLGTMGVHKAFGGPYADLMENYTRDFTRFLTSQGLLHVLHRSQWVCGAQNEHHKVHEDMIRACTDAWRKPEIRTAVRLLIWSHLIVPFQNMQSEIDVKRAEEVNELLNY